MIKQIKLYYNYLLIPIGLGIVLWVIWVRFIRSRVPRDIPFELTEKWLFILIYICMIYFFMVYKLIRPGKAHETIALLVEIFFMPLVAFDAFIKKNKYIQPKYLKFVDKTITFLSFYKEESEQVRIIKRIYIACYIIPRLILVFILCLDTFYFYKLAWIYKIVLLSISPLLLRYLIYSIKYINNQYIKDLDTKYDEIHLSDKNYTKVDWIYNQETMKYHDTEVSLEEYIRIQLEIIAMNNPKISYDAWPYSKEYRYVQYRKDKYNDNKAKLTEEDLDSLKRDFYQSIPIILHLSLFLKNYSEVDYIYLFSKSTHILIKHIKIMIFSLYGICWAYIIYRSYHMIPYPFMDTLCTLVKTLPALEEPFSGNLIIYL